MYVYNGTLSKILYKRRNLSPWAYRLWDACYASYLFVLFPLKYALASHEYLPRQSPGELRRVMCEAWRDARGLEQVTRQRLVDFRARVAARRAAATAAQASTGSPR